MGNERITEDLIRTHFKADPLAAAIKIEEQRSSSRRIGELLREASKAGTGRVGYPEFILSFPAQHSDYLIIVECKQSIARHRSSTLSSPKDFAVDGVLHYSKYLNKAFDVIAIAISGQSMEELIVSTFRFNRNGSYEELAIHRLLSINDYLKLFNNAAFSETVKSIDIIQKAVYLNEEFHSCSVTEGARCTIVSAILIGLLDNPFKHSYKTYETTQDLGVGLLDSIKRVLKSKQLRNSAAMSGEFNKILNEPLFTQTTIKKDKISTETIAIVKEFIDYIANNVFPLVGMDDIGYDVLGKFYTEFIRYAGSSQKQGRVLTPHHITELFCHLAQIKRDTVLYDPVCGTAGFLITGMKWMLDLALGDSSKQEQIKNMQLVGVELRPDMYTYACTNMMFRGDGRANIYNNDAFNLEKQIISEHSPTVAFLNPPYDVGVVAQMEFVEHALRTVAPKHGIVVAIVQVGCAIKNIKQLKVLKEKLLQHHRLKAVISTPDELFYPVSVNTCIMVWEAGVNNSGYETWFGYLKDDGFEKRKHKGRIDVSKSWQGIRDSFVYAYNNSREVPGLSVKHLVKGEDEWCAEAYLETDYKALRREEFEMTIRQLLAYRVRTSLVNVNRDPASNDVGTLNVEHWKDFTYKTVFRIQNGYYNKKPVATEPGSIPFLGATDRNNGVTEYYSYYDIESQHKDERSKEHDIALKLFAPNQISVTNNGSVGFAFYQESQFTCSHDVNVLSLKDRELNPHIAMFLCTLIQLEQYRWNYGRKWRPARMPYSVIKLPVKADGSIDWQFMESYIKSLPYSSSL